LDKLRHFQDRKIQAENLCHIEHSGLAFPREYTTKRSSLSSVSVQVFDSWARNDTRHRVAADDAPLA